jgi:Asp-tRNA(Asn)/Glu-tRNA(Gln) amidotransferase A subunit family amidase
MAVLGPSGRTADDLDLSLDVLAGPDEWSATAWQLRLPPARDRSLSDHRVGAWLDDSASPVDSEVLGVLEAAVTQLASAGARRIWRTARQSTSSATSSATSADSSRRQSLRRPPADGSGGYRDASRASSLAWASAWAAWVPATVPPKEVRASSVRLP